MIEFDIRQEVLTGFCKYVYNAVIADYKDPEKVKKILAIKDYREVQNNIRSKKNA